MRAMIAERALLAAAPRRCSPPPGAGVAGPLDGVTISSLQGGRVPLRDNGSGPIADWVAADLPGYLRQSFAPHWSSGRRARHRTPAFWSRARSPSDSSRCNDAGRSSFWRRQRQHRGRSRLVDSRGRELARIHSNSPLRHRAAYERHRRPGPTHARASPRCCQQFAIWAAGAGWAIELRRRGAPRRSRLLGRARRVTRSTPRRRRGARRRLSVEAGRASPCRSWHAPFGPVDPARCGAFATRRCPS